ncbi:sensor histidine kinase [Actinokineospora sp. NBRC 105648]|uniref:sensor histidine kinase n=1 Tax=Actinokineospora sp. NBRC 105648 TaxID=3032206 RepID=UPI0024A12FB8|nr:sensor histidine kinase [Actinokineospora sp. NBRC 105648]GLZ37332.1 anti-sigma regulatory factor [Actinokineospora sp. NBRC 105648]
MSAPGFTHEALVYRDATAFAANAAGYLREGLAAGEFVFAVLPPPGTELLRAALGEQAGDVRFLDMADLGRNPARLIPAIRGQVSEAGDRPVRGIGESAWVGRSAAEHAEVVLHEALINLAFEEASQLRLCCALDGTGVPGDVLAAARHTHPVIVEDTRTMSDRFDHDYAHDHFAGELPAPDSVSDVVHFCLDDLPELRDLVGVRARHFGLTRERALDLTLATNEMVTNSICHGGERGTLRLWTDGETFVCEISDSGHIPDPLVGRIAPIPSVQGGRGVWLANQLCDLVRIRSTASTGTVVRLHVNR